MVLDHVVIPKRDEYGNEADEHALHSSDVRYPVEGSVPWSGDDFLTEVHLDREVNLHVFAFLVRHQRLFLQHEDPVVSQLCQLV